MNEPFDIEGEQERQWKVLWGISSDAEWDRLWEYLFKLAKVKLNEEVDRLIRKA